VARRLRRIASRNASVAETLFGRFRRVGASAPRAAAMPGKAVPPTGPTATSDMPRVATFSRPLNAVGEGSLDGNNSPAKPGDGSFQSSMEGTFHTQVRAGGVRAVRVARDAAGGEAGGEARRRARMEHAAPHFAWRACAAALRRAARASSCVGGGAAAWRARSAPAPRAPRGTGEVAMRVRARATTGALRTRPHDDARALHSLAQDPQAVMMHRIAELLFYCSVGNLKAVKKLVRPACAWRAPSRKPRCVRLQRWR
jgi:hypothetical protein